MSFNNDGCKNRKSRGGGKMKEILSWNECNPPPPPLATQLLSTTLYIYFMKKWGALKMNNY
jgi:hypothetical protein